MALTVLAGETVRITARDLTHSDSGSVTTGATVTVGIYDSADTIVGSTATGATGGSGDDWYADITAPSNAGEYTVKVTAVKTGATWKSKEPLIVKAF
jgi:hypothetical protein